jgi:hypothetical protein
LWLKYGVDIDKYLLKETLDWCIQQLNMHNIDLGGLSGGSTISGGLRAHTQAYLCLRDIVRSHHSDGTTPHLQESPKPIGGYQVVMNQEGELSRLIQGNAEFVRRQENQEFVEGMENLLIQERENPDVFEDTENHDILGDHPLLIIQSNFVILT